MFISSYETNRTTYSHNYGDIVTLNDKLVAIAGNGGRKVEIYDGENWNDTIIPSVGNYDKTYLNFFTTLVINNALYVFGIRLFEILNINCVIIQEVKMNVGFCMKFGNIWIPSANGRKPHHLFGR